MISNKYDIKSKKNIFVLIKVFLIVFLLIMLFFSFFRNFNSVEIDSKKYTFCNLEINLLIESYNAEIIEQDLYIYPDVENLKCIGKIINYYNDKNLTLIFATNKKLYNFINLTYSTIYIIFSYLLIKYRPNLFNKLLIFSNYVLFSFLINYIFVSRFNFNFLFKNLEIFISFFSTLLFFGSLIFQNKKIIIFSFYFFSTFNYEYFGIYALCVLLFISFKKMDRLETKLIYFLPIYFYGLRYFATFSEKFDLLWKFQFQKSYFGYSRFIDFQGDFFLLNCNKDNTISYQIKFKETILNCPEIYGYGPLRKLIALDFNIWKAVLIVSFFVLFLSLITKNEIANKYKNHQLLVTLFFISPPVNVLIHHMNPDVIYFSTLVILFKRFRENHLVLAIILSIYSLWKIHILGIIFGLVVFFFLKNDVRKVLIYMVSILFSLIVYYFDTKYTEPLKIPPAPDENWHFGIFADTEKITGLFGINSQLSFYIIYFTFIILSILLALKNRKLIVDKIVIDKNFEFFGFVFWFFLCMVYKNQTYRLGLFIFLILYLSIGIKDNFLKKLIYFSIFLNPIFYTYSSLSKYISITLNRASLYLVFILLLAIVFDELIEYFKSKRITLNNFYNNN